MNVSKVKIGGETKKFFIKIISDPNHPFYGSFFKHEFDKIEINFYKKMLPKLVEFEKRFIKSELESQFVPKFFKGDFCLNPENRGFYLILEDISQDFQMNKNGFNFDQINGILVKMAHFHALTFAYSQKVEKFDLESFYERLMKGTVLYKMMETNFDIFLNGLSLNQWTKVDFMLILC